MINNTDKENVKAALKAVQDKVTDTAQAISKMMAAEIFTESFFESKMNDIIDNAEDVCLSARNTVEKYRYLFPYRDKLKARHKTISHAAGEIEVTAEGWIHIRLNALLPHCKYKNDPYLGDTLKRLIDEFEQPLPRYRKAFLAIIESCDYDSRRVFDQDNKAWKMIPNAIKGRVIEDDDQFHLDIGLFSKFSPDLACDVYILPEEQLSDFMYYLSNNLL